MPEGHLVHHLAREHTRALAGGPVSVSSPQGRFAREAAVLDGRVLIDVDAFGKHLFYLFEGDALVHVHLGMKGVTLLRSSSAAPVPQARVRLSREERAVDIIAPAVCELGDRELRAHVTSKLGHDPLRDDIDEQAAKRALREKNAAIGAVLLDQSVIAGVGNVLRAEALHAARLHPSRSARSLSENELDRLWRNLGALMRRGAEIGRVLPYLDEGDDPATVEEASARAVYRRQSCRVCGSEVEHPKIGGREAWLCPRCQPEETVSRWPQHRSPPSAH